MTALSSLNNRIFLATAILVVLSMGIAIYWVSDSVARQAERDLETGLAEAASLVDQFSQRQFIDFLVKSRFIAEIPPMRAAASIDHPPTVQPIAEEMQDRIDADFLVVFGSADRVLARAAGLRPARAGRDELVAPCARPLQMLCCTLSFAPVRIEVSRPLNPETDVGDQVGGR